MSASPTDLRPSDDLTLLYCRTRELGTMEDECQQDEDPDDFNEGILLPSLILQLRSILERYPDDGQILKEIIQNAEDAGASKVIFLIDNTTYGTDVSKLHHSGLAKYQGPALYAYNDAVFRYADWKGIRMLDNSVKADDPLKIGRFGLGFKSVFHMTDLPSIFSSKGIGFIDPHRECFEYQPPGCNRTIEKTTAFFWHLGKDHDAIARLKDQFEPFLQPLFQVTPETFQSNYFKGTVFRFPFRTAEMTSDLSKTTYNSEKVHELVRSLKANAHHILLFLKKLQSVEVYEKTRDGNTSKLLEIKIEESYQNLIKKKLSEFQRNINVEWREQPSVSVTYPIAINVEIWDAGTSVNTTHVWLVSQYYAGAEESPAVTLSSDKGHLPLVGVALPIQTSSEQPLCDTDPIGHVFCFLPLPLERKSPTGLRFHVHGNFAVDQNRRHIKWPSADREAAPLTDDAHIWNHFLVNVVLPKAAIDTIAYLTLLQPTADEIPAHFRQVVLTEALQKDAEFIARLVYAVFPDLALVSPQWKELAEAIYRNVWTDRFFHTIGGKWIAYSDAIFRCNDEHDPMDNLIGSILCEDDRNLVTVPRYIKDQLPDDAMYITPDIVRDSLRNVQHQIGLTDEARRLLLEYLLEFSKDRQSDFVGLVLLPLKNGTWTKFEMANSVKKVYVASKEHPQSLLPGLEGRFLKPGIATNDIEQLVERGVTQLKYFNPEDFREMLGDVLRKWQAEETVELEIESWFNRSWLESLWKYMHDHFRNELQIYEGLHILPIGNGYVAKLSQQLPVVSRVDNFYQDEPSLEEELVQLCNQVGVIVLEDLEPKVLQHSTFVWGNYVLRPNARGVLTALLRLEKQLGNVELVKLFEDVPNKSKEYFRDFIGRWISKDNCLSTDDVKLLRTLPIFPTVNGSGGQIATFVSVADGTRVAPLKDDIPLPCPEVLLDISDILARSLGVNPPSIPDHLIDVYFPAVSRNYYDRNEIIELMKYVCNNLLLFEKVNENIVTKAKEISFVPRLNGSPVRPSDVYENDGLLGKLFAGADVFPVDEFAKDEFKMALLKLGLKTAEAVTPQEAFAVAEKLSELSHPSQSDLEQSGAFMKYLDQHGHRVLPCIISEGKSLLVKLTEVKWVNISSARPPMYPSQLMFAAENLENNFLRPNEVFTQDHAYLVGSVRCTIDTSAFPFLERIFSWTAVPGIHDVSRHLLNTIASYDAFQKSEVFYILNHVYKWLSEHVYRSTSDKNLHLQRVQCDEELRSVLRELEPSPWVWHGDGFVRTSQMALDDNHGIDMRPYVYILPKESAQFNQLWIASGIKEKYDYIEVLEAIKRAHDENDTALMNKDHDLKLAINILNELANRPPTDERRREIVVPIHTETERLEMKSVDECAYCDTEWDRQEFDDGDPEDIQTSVIHELIPITTAEKLKIPSLIGSGVEGLNMEFGQNEPLTRRLHSILCDYTDGLAVLKELIQNADDAGASEIRFLYDERSNEDAQQKLLDEGMKGLQGPALWTYNNADFSDDDFESITKLGGATKDGATEKIGRFGLGFNAVYNLTDVPMFISGQNIVIFDPHTTYLGKALTNKAQPGIRLNLDLHKKIIRRRADQFKPMNGIFGCELGDDSTVKPFKGTLFRFPLRTLPQARESKISDVCYSREEIHKLLKLLYDTNHSLLLHTQNVREITVHHLSEMDSPPDGIREWFSIQKDLVKALRSITSPSATMSAIEAQCAILKQATVVLDGYRRNPGTGIRKLDSSSVLKFTVNRGIEFPENFQGDTSNDISEWLVVSSIGTGKSLHMAINSEKKNIVPVGGVAARLEKTTDGRYRAVSVDEARGGMLFCFLPLPMKTCFPVHVNGFFDVQSSRMHLYERSPLDKNIDSRAIWNEDLLDDAVTRAYCVLLEDLATLSPELDSYALWPVKLETGLVGRLTHSLYRSMCLVSSNMNVVKTMNGWSTVLKSKILSREFRGLEIGEVALLALDAILKYTQSDEDVVDIPDNITQTILQTDCASVIKERSVSKVDFYSKWFLPNIGITDPLQRDQLILHALTDKEIACHLRGIQCIPVSPDGFPLKSIEKLIHPKSEIAVLFEEREGMFPKWTSGVEVDSHVYERLVRLGMRKDDLSWEEILTRCKLISMNPVTAATHTPVLLKIIEKKLKNESNEGNAPDVIVGQIRDVKFLPVMRKPEDFPLSWKGDDYLNDLLISCKEGYLQVAQGLVSCCYPIIDETVFAGSSCFKTKQKLCLINKPIDPTAVVQQILEIIDVTQPNDVANNSGLSSECLKMLSEMYDAAFNWLNHCFKENLLEKSTVNPLVSRKSIRIRNNYFLSPNRCAMQFPTGNDTLLPHLAAVPDDLATYYPAVLEAIGVKEAFLLGDYVRVLSEIKEQAGNRCLDERELSVAIHLITICVYEEIKSKVCNEIEPADRELLNEMPIPNAEGRMCSAKNLRFNNCVWLTAETERSKFCHDRISHEIASALGLQTIRQDILKRHQLAVPFGQRERLVTRIKAILKGYPFSEDILKEMLQNADDAGAKEIHFILDTRTLPDEKVFEDSWKPLQGPALCIYNDRSFSESDLGGIQRLGEGGKADDPTTTGQYGVGFNCVYHLTDVPTFLTTIENRGTVLCAFDPNCRFVPGATSDSPGAMFKVEENLKEQFVDVFKGYSFEYGQYDVSRTGTMFRLPLRNRITAEASEISKDLVTVEAVEDIFEKFKSDLNEAMLFVNSVEKIQLVRIEDANCGSELVELRTVLYEVEVQMTEKAKSKRAEFHNYAKESAKLITNQQISLSEVNVKEVSYQMKIRDSDGIKDTWQIVQRFGFEDATVVPADVVNAVHSRKLGLLPRVGVALLRQTTGTGTRTNRLFCFLPLPVPIQLPVHVNGHFSLDQNRRNLWIDVQNNDIRTNWNRSLMIEVVAPAYCTMLGVERDRIKRLASTLQLNRYYEAFPLVDSSNDSYVNSMAFSVYKYIILENLELLSVQSDVNSLSATEWRHPLGEEGRPIYFDDLESQMPRGKSSTVREVLVRSGFSMFSCPDHVRKSFLDAGQDAGVSVVSPTTVLDFFATHSDQYTRCKVTNLPEEISKTPFQNIESLVTLLEYCTKANEYKSRLERMPFLVTLDDTVSQFDSGLVKYVSKHSCVAPHISGEFMNMKIKHVLKLEPTTDVSLCKEFTVDEFSMTIRNLVKKTEFYDAENWFPESELHDFLKPYNTDSLQWLRNIWSFLSSFLNEMTLWSEDQDKKVVDKLLKPLMKCCLLPVLTPKGETLLYPLCLSSGVIAEPSINESCSEVAMLLYALGVAKPNYGYIHNDRKSSQIDRLLKYSLGTVQQPVTVIEALRIAMKHQLVEFTLVNDEGLRLLEYFSMHINNWKDTPRVTETIVMLPFFLTFWNKQAILGDSKAYVLPSEIPTSGTECLMTEGQDIRLLKNISSLKPLLKHLGCIYLNVEASYCSFILKHFHKLSRDAQLVHLSFVKQQVLLSNLSVIDDRGNARSRFLEILKKMPLIPDKANMLQPASAFYDPQNEIFQVMREDDRYPSDPYNRADWLPFLRMCGLVHEITEEMFLSYARQVAKNSLSCIDNTVVKQSETLVRHFLSRKDHSRMNLQSVRNVRFVSPGIVSESLESLHIQYGTRDDNQRLRFVCFSDAALHCNDELVWTVLNLLPQWIQSKPKSSGLFSELHVVSQSVPTMTVVEHVQKLCSALSKESLASNTQKAKTLTQVLQKALKFIATKVALEDEAKNILSRTCCVFVAETFDLVAPSQVAIDITTKDEIRPYLFKIPPEYAIYAPVLQQLGTTNVLTANQYAFALRKIADASHGKIMHPEEMKACCRASEGLLNLIEKGETVDGDKIIFLPCTDKKLYKASEVIFNDKTQQLLQRLSGLDWPILIDSKEFKIEGHRMEIILKKMPISQRPRLLSQIVHEGLADGQLQRCEFAEKTAARLRDPVFRSGLKRLFRHCFVKEMRGQLSWNEETLIQICKQLMDRLDSIEFVGRVQVQTCLIRDGRKLDGSEKNLKYFQEKSGNNDNWKFYISAGAFSRVDEQRLYRDIARILNSALGKRILDESLLALILDCPIHEIQELLDCKDITESVEHSFVPPLGSYIPEEHLHLLVQDTFIFYPGQLVALEIDDPFDRGELGEPAFILVEIIERQDPDNPLSKYKIRVSFVEERIVDATSLYAFSRYNIAPSHDQRPAIHARQEGAAGIPTPTPTETPKVKTLEEIVEEIKKILKEAWKGTLDERKKIRKRLYLRWHPDKNPDQIPLCTEVCKHLQHLIELLEKGRSIDDYSTSSSSSSSRSTRSRTSSDFDEFYRRAGQRANYFNQRRDRSYRGSSWRYSGGFYSSWQEHENFFTGFRSNRNPQSGEARRWMRQARHDLGAVVNDHNAFDWKCLKCFEAAKIALMAIQYATDSNSVPSVQGNLVSLLDKITDAEIRRLSFELDRLVSGEPRMKYPRGHDYPRIPGEVYGEGQAREAYRLSEQILNRCDQLIEIS